MLLKGPRVSKNQHPTGEDFQKSRHRRGEDVSNTEGRPAVTRISFLLPADVGLGRRRADSEARYSGICSTLQW